MSSEELKRMPMPSLGELIDWVWQLKEDRDAALAQLAAIQSVMAEAVEVRGLQWLDTGHYRKKPPQFGYNPHDWNPLMTVAQHQRITAAMAAEVERLESQRKELAATMLSQTHELMQARAELEAARKQEPVAYRHTMHQELGQQLVFVSVSEHQPFGVRGEDFDDAYSVTTEPLFALPPLAGQVAVPDVLFDGHAVYTEVRRLRALKGGNDRTSPENVSDTLDAVVSLLRAEFGECEHEWFDASNARVSSCVMCSKCFAIKGADRG